MLPDHIPINDYICSKLEYSTYELEKVIIV